MKLAGIIFIIIGGIFIYERILINQIFSENNYKNYTIGINGYSGDGVSTTSSVTNIHDFDMKILKLIPIIQIVLLIIAGCSLIVGSIFSSNTTQEMNDLKLKVEQLENKYILNSC